MTRNNLKEHLSWLLDFKPSVPVEGNTLPPVTISFTQAGETQTAADTSVVGREEAEGSGEEIAPVAPNAQAAARPQDMARLRAEAGSANKPGLVTMGSRMHDTPVQNARENGPARPYGSNAIPAPGAASGPRPTPFSTARQVPFSPQQDVEMLDMTEQVRSPASNVVAGRKRKSAEMVHELPGDTPVRAAAPRAAEAMQPPPSASQQSFTAIDEIFEAPSEPPPPYSTIAPRQAPPIRRHIHQTTTTSRPRPAGPEDSPMMPDSEDEDDLVDFSRSRSRTPACKRRAVEKQQSMFPERVNGSPSKPAPLLRGESFTVLEKDVEKALRTTFSPERKTVPQPRISQDTVTPPSATANEVPSEDAAMVEQLFALSSSELEACCERLNTEYERRLDDVADCIENGRDEQELQKALDSCEHRHDSMKALVGKQKEYQSLLDEKEPLRAALKAAIRAKTGVEDARAALGAWTSRNKALIAECVRHVLVCKDEVSEVLKQKESGSKKVAVESTQAPSANTAPKQPCVPSSSRIAQTQVVQSAAPPQRQQPAAPPRRENPPNFEAFAKQSAAPPELSRHEDDEEDYGYVNDSDMIEASNQAFSNRMGTPPVRFDDDEFDDDIMLDYAEDIENYGTRPAPTHGNSMRPPLAMTSGNSQPQAGQQSPKKKKKKRTPSKHDDANLEHLFRFPWSADVKDTLKTRFGLKGFRENQVEAINATLAGKDVFVLMPTGGGKSLCYQLPALVTSGNTRGVTVVVSPLLSLMEDQVNHLRKLEVQAFLINSESDQSKRQSIIKAMDEPEVEEYVQLLYITPEMLSKSGMMNSALDRLHRRQKLARLVIDEAHCVSQWGHDFRPDYKLIGDVRRRFQSVPVMALTATATENVRMDTVHNLGIDGCKILTSSFNRPNLYYEVRAKPKGKEDVKAIAELIKENYHGKSGIIYCLSRKNCETMAAALHKEHRIKAHHYHAGLEPEEKRQVQKDWQKGKHNVIVATIAFGMGIDKPDVRFVIHHTVPKSLEGYYQETGRAGRDQLPSGCYLFFGYQDMGKLRRMIDDGEGDWQQKERQHQMLRKMAQYCDNRSDCRRVQVLRYFNEDFDPDECDDQCDNCRSAASFQNMDFTDYAKKAVALVSKLAPQRSTLLHCMDVFRGASNKKIKEDHLNELEEYGAGKDLDRENIERLFYHLLTERAIIEENVMNKSGFANQYAMLGKYSSDFRSGRKKLFMQVRSTPKPKSKAPAKKKSKKDPLEEQSKNWKKTAGSRAPPELPMSTNISSPVQAATSRRNPTTRNAGRMHDNGYKRDNFVVSDPEDGDYGDSDEDSFDDGFAPLRVAGQQRLEKTRAPSRPITADEMLNELDDVARDMIEQFVQDGKDVCRKVVLDRSLRVAPFTDTMLRHMAIMRTTTPDDMAKIPDVNPENIKLFGNRFCKLVKEFLPRYDEVMMPAERPDPNARNVIDLVSDEEEESSDEYGEFPSDFDEDGQEQSSYFPPRAPVSAGVAAFNARMDLEPAYGSSGAAKPKKAAKSGGRKRNYKATGSTAAPKRRAPAGGGGRLASYAYGEGGPSAAGAGKKRSYGGKRKSGEGGKSGGASKGAGRGAAKSAAANRSIVSMMPT